MNAIVRLPPVRPEFERDPDPPEDAAPERPRPWPERLWQRASVRKGVILLVLAAAWEAFARWQDNDLLLPTFSATVRALVEDGASGTLGAKVLASLGVLIEGYGSAPPWASRSRAWRRPAGSGGTCCPP